MAGSYDLEASEDETDKQDCGRCRTDTRGLKRKDLTDVWPLRLSPVGCRDVLRRFAAGLWLLRRFLAPLLLGHRGQVSFLSEIRPQSTGHSSTVVRITLVEDGHLAHLDP